MKKTVLITGTSSGVGKSTAMYFHNKGWNVAATMRNVNKGAHFDGLDHLLCIELDVTKIDSIKKAVQLTINKFGSIDAVINNAAYTLTGPFEAAAPEQIKDFYDVDVFGVMNVTREVLPHFRKLGRGTFVNITSLGGRIGMPLSSFYASAKWAVEGFSESIRFELEKLGILVKIVEPGGIKTNFAKNAIIVRKKDVPSYEDSMKRRIEAYEKRKDKLNDPLTIAKVIYEAATDNKKRLRYLAGNDAKLLWKLYSILPFHIFSSLLKKLAG